MVVGQERSSFMRGFCIESLLGSKYVRPENPRLMFAQGQTFGSQIFFISSGERNFGFPVLRGLRLIILRNHS
jgi:hypothetical protein